MKEQNKKKELIFVLIDSPDIPEKKKVSKEEIVDEWTSDIEALEKEIAAQG